jgi:ferric enterobactin receptor
MNKTFLLILIFTCFAQRGWSQTGMIKGRVAEVLTHKPIEYATIIVTDNRNKKVVTGGTTDGAGAFKIDNVPFGSYRITTEFIGYKRDTIDGVLLSVENNEVKLNSISLRPSQHTLADITIIAAQPVIENKIDKLVYNVANDITSQGGVALDVLKKVPQVGVDIDGNVDIQGNGNIRFLINGKPSSIFNSPIDALSSIPASQIKSIEVISSPGAKYDAEGTGGIINIILKDNKLEGINGNIMLSGGTRLENGLANLNIKKGNIGISAFFSGNAQLVSHTPNSQNRSSYDALHNNLQLNQTGYTDFQRQGYQSGITFNWSISKRDNLSASIGYNYIANKSVNSYLQDQQTFNSTQQLTSDLPGSRSSLSKFVNKTIEPSLSYRRIFQKEGQELDIRYSSSFGNPQNDYTLTQLNGASVPFSGSQGHSPGTDQETDVAIDYTHPVSKNTILEVGVKTIIELINSATDVSVLDTTQHPYDLYRPDNTQSYQLKYERKIYAGYLSASFNVGTIKVKAGVRYERTNGQIDFPNTIIPDYNSFVPSLILLKELENDRTVKFIYAHRIERPEYRQVDPFVNRSDPYNLTTGNPLLQPEIGDNFELSYNKTFNKAGSISIALFERIDIQDLKPVTSFYPAYKVGDSVYTNVSVTMQQNIGEEYNTGVTLYGSSTIKDKLNVHLFVLAAQRYVASSLAPNGVAIGYRLRANINGSYQLPHNLVGEVFCNYNSASQLLQGRIPQSLTYTIAGRKQFWNKNASIGFTATNIFSKYIRQVTTINGADYSSYTVRDLPYRSVGISFTYKFGKLDFKKSKDDSYLNNPPD